MGSFKNRRPGKRIGPITGGLVLLWTASVIAAAPAGFADVPFTPPEKITTPDHKYQLSRNPRGCMALDSERTLHAVYWRGGLTTTPDTPSRILYRTWTPASGWSTEWEIDDSYVAEGPDAGRFIGGRQPSLTLLPDDTVWVAWHDHRHCQGTPGNWIDNIEMYADFRIHDGTFTTGDVRLTTSSASHNGDNGYLARLAAGPDARVHMTWYDYFLDRSMPDIYLKSMLPGGTWDLAETMPAMRLVGPAEFPAALPFVCPDLAIDPAGRIHLAWASSLNDSDGDLYYGSVSPGGTFEGASLFRANASSYWDPPRCEVDPEGDFWLVWSDKNDNPLLRELYCARRPLGAGSLDPPIRITNTSHAESQPDMEVDASGLLHLVWVDSRSGTHVYYGIFDPVSLSMLSEQPLTTESASWTRPTILLDSRGEIYVLFEKDTSVSTGEVHFTTTRLRDLAVVPGWQTYR